MKNKKLIILYILMLLIGLALLFTGTPEKKEIKEIQQPPQKVEVTNLPPPKPVIEMVNIAVAKTDLASHTIITPNDYYFKTIEVPIGKFDKSKYILDPTEINNYVVKNNIQRESLVQKNLIASPYTEEYRMLTLKNGEFVFPIDIAKEDSYLLKNLQVGDLIDIYIVFGYDRNKSNNINGVVSPGHSFSTTNIKPIVAGKKIFFIENDATTLTSTATTRNRSGSGRIDLVLTNEEIKLVRTLMANSKIILYPSAFSKNLDKGMFLLTEKEQNWPESQEQIFNFKPVARLRGN